METPAPTVIRRKVAFASAIYDAITVEGVRGIRVDNTADIFKSWQQRQIPVLCDPEWTTLDQIKSQILVDAIIAKKNLGTRITDARLVIGLGPGFTAKKDVHIVIETQRGHDLGKIISSGSASANTSQPEAVLGITADRLLRAPCPGRFTPNAAIGESVVQGQILGHVDDEPVKTKIAGVIRGLIHDGVRTNQGRKIGDVDPRGKTIYCHTVSDKAMALGGSVLEAVLGQFNR